MRVGSNLVSASTGDGLSIWHVLPELKMVLPIDVRLLLTVVRVAAQQAA